ncbi:MAG: RagB/SusD family nutrient uptake outer membrane protein [Saprospiraceae bacterium]
MKNKLIILLSILVFTSCSEEFLEVTPVGRVLESNFYQNQEQAFEALVAVYDVLQWNDQGGFTMFRPLLDAASDDCFAGGSDASDQPSWVAWDAFSLNPDLGPQWGFWNKNYRGIYRANLFLEKIEGVEATPQFKTRTTAEVRFLRAKFYFDLVRLFGRVPLITNTLGSDEYYTINQTDGSEIFPFIEDELNAAIADLPETVSGSELGRITKGAARGLLGRVILFQNDNGKMGTAASVLENIINSGNYSLEPNFGDIFDINHEHGQESVFEISYSDNSIADWWMFGSGNGEGNVGVQFVGMRDYSGPTFATGWGFCPVTPNLVTAMTGDPRFEHTIIDASTLQGASYTAGYQETGYFVRKYAPLQANTAGDGAIPLNWANNVREIRYADVLLMAAEALVRSGGDESKARGYVNEVRARVGLGAITSSGNALLEDIYTERRLELACEGQRFFDLVRTGKAATALASDGFVAGKSEVLPIPQSEMDLANGALTQNPGY